MTALASPFAANRIARASAHAGLTRWSDLLLALLVAGLFLLAPHTGNFAWSDAPRHALNGVFVKDLIAAMPLHDPAGFAYRYYAQYPALTILFSTWSARRSMRCSGFRRRPRCWWSCSFT